MGEEPLKAKRDIIQGLAKVGGLLNKVAIVAPEANISNVPKNSALCLLGGGFFDPCIDKYEEEE